MEIKSLNTFIQVAELGSFSRAGERLGYSQPTISVQIRQLEQELGVRLFDRVGHAVRLTDSGQELLGYAQQICRIQQQMLQDVRDESEPTAVIRLAVADSLCVPLIEDSFAEFRSRHPGIALKILTGGTGELFRLLDHGEADLVCTMDTHVYNTKYTIAAEERVGVHFVVCPDHPLVERKGLSKKDLMEHPVLLTEKGMSYRRLLDEWMAGESLELQPVLEMGSADLLCRLVEKGAGISFLPDYVTQTAARRGTVVRLEGKGFRPELWKQLLYRRDKWLSRPIEAVIAHFSGLWMG